MSSKPTVALLCGGQSPEHEISLLSAWSVYQAIDRQHYEVLVVGIDKKGVWYNFGDSPDFLLQRENPERVRLADHGKVCFFCRNCQVVRLWELGTGQEFAIDLAFPVLHGANGEDGTIQGLFQMLSLKYVGCDQTSSANCMDKDISKILLKAQNIRVAPGICLHRKQLPEFEAGPLLAQLGLPLFVKPARTGSSIGVSKVKSEQDLLPAIQNAFSFDDKILLEQAIVGREIECAVLDDGDSLFCPAPGEVIPHDEFYSYKAKYIDKAGATLKVPAELSQDQADEVSAIAKAAFKALGCRGMARVDFFLPADGLWVLNELNTIPGFTNISLYPQLMLKAGLSYPSLIDKLLQRAMKN
ncbi:MAG: D-alanine--D-alanine ligase family protein [Lentisphaeria bacterium]